MPKAVLTFFVALAALAVVTSVAHAQTVTLDGYVQEGLASNLALRQQDFSYQKSEQALREARGLFFPSLNLGARYSDLSGNVVSDESATNPSEMEAANPELAIIPMMPA